MKNIIAFSIILAFAGCKKPCEDACLNGGTAVVFDKMCVCECPTGYSGIECEIYTPPTPCQANNTGTLKVYCNYPNDPFDVFVDGVLVGVVDDYWSSYSFPTQAGSVHVYAENNYHSNVHYEDDITVPQCGSVNWTFP